MRLFGRLAALTFVALFMAACGPFVRTIDRVKFTPPPEAASQGGLSLEITPLGLREMAEQDDFSVAQSGFKWVILDAPAFRAKVSNSNEHIVRLSGSVIKLADKDKILYDVTTKGELKTSDVRTFQRWAGEHYLTPETTTQTIAAIEDRVDALRLLDQSTEILPGFSGVYYLAFNTPTKSIKTELDYNSWVMRHAPFTLMMFDVITATDQAGNVSRKSRFEFPIQAIHVRETYQDGILIKTEPAPN